MPKEYTPPPVIICWCCGKKGRRAVAGLRWSCAQIMRKLRPLVRDDMEARRAEVIRAVQDGMCLEDIACLLDLSLWQVRHALQDHGHKIREIRSGTVRVRTMRQVGLLFGVSHKYVSRWVDAGLLRASCRKRSERRPILVPDLSIMEFISDRMTWPHWAVDKITELDWQEYARDAQRAGRWIKVRDIMESRHYHLRAASWYVKRGDFPGAVLLNGAYYVWEETQK